MRNGSNGLNLPVAGLSNSSGGRDFAFRKGICYSPDDGGGSGGADDGGGGEQSSSELDKKIADAVAEATAGLKKNNKELLDDRAKLKEQSTTSASELEALRKEIGATGSSDLSKVQELLKKANDDEERELIKANDIDGLVARRLTVERGNSKHQLDVLTNDIGSLKAENEQLVQANRKLLIGGNIRKASEVAGMIPGAIDIAEREGMTNFDIENGKMIAKNDDGTTRFEDDGKTPYGASAYVEGLRKTHAFMFPPSEGGGSQGHHNPGLKGAKETYTLDQWSEKTSKATPDERKELIKRKAKGEIAVK